VPTIIRVSNAEDVWLEMRAKGHNLSISSFYSRLKELVERGRVEKRLMATINIYTKQKPL
jgi:Fe2+ or Zn2+ uptake regulation protein